MEPDDTEDPILAASKRIAEHIARLDLAIESRVTRTTYNRPMCTLTHHGVELYEISGPGFERLADHVIEWLDAAAAAFARAPSEVAKLGVALADAHLDYEAAAGELIAAAEAASAAESLGAAAVAAVVKRYDTGLAQVATTRAALDKATRAYIAAGGCS